MTKENTLGVAAMVLIGLLWVISPAATILLIGGVIGGLGLLVWVMRKIGMR